MIVKGKGNQRILPYFFQPPYMIIINDVPQIINFDLTYNFTDEENTVILKWMGPLMSCKEMFKNMNSIKSIDFSKFDSSIVSDMSGMFEGCSQLQSINFKNFNTSSVTDMTSMFSNISIDFLDLSNFNTSKVKSMKKMFSNSHNLETVILSNFNTSSVENMEYMFSDDPSLILLNLTNFDISSVSTMEYMFEGCKSLLYINLISFKEKNDVNISNIFSNITNLTYCIDKDKSPKISEELEFRNFNNNCENICFSKSNFIPKKAKCIDNCTNDTIYKCEYKNICFETCPEIEDNEDSSTIEWEMTETSNNNENTKTENTQKTVQDDKIENTVTDLEKTEIAEKTQEIENNLEILKNFSSENFFQESNNNLITQNVTVKDEIIKNIKNDIINGKLNSLLTNVTNGNKDLIVKSNDTSFQITTTNHQKNNEYNNISTLDIGDCEDRLKNIYNIDRDLSLIIFKVDYYKEGSITPIICYEIYHPVNKSQLDLNYCKDILINLNIPVSIDEDNYFKYDPNSEFYNDQCYTYTTDKGTDIILNDRQNEYNNNNLSICENNCTLEGYDSDTKKASCECETKSKINLISEIIQDEKILSNYFNTTEKSGSNIITMKCVNTLFTKEGLLTNIGSYILLFSIFLCILTTIFFIILDFI